MKLVMISDADLRKIVNQKDLTPEQVIKKIIPSFNMRDDRVFCKVGQILLRKTYPDCVYAVQRVNDQLRIVNLTHCKPWDGKMLLNDMQCPAKKEVTVHEFKTISEGVPFDDFLLHDVKTGRTYKWVD